MFPASGAIQKTKSNLKRSFIAFEVHYGIDHVDLMSPVVLFWTPLQMALSSNSVLDEEFISDHIWSIWMLFLPFPACPSGDHNSH